MSGLATNQELLRSQLYGFTQLGIILRGMHFAPSVLAQLDCESDGFLRRAIELTVRFFLEEDDAIIAQAVLGLHPDIDFGLTLDERLDRAAALVSEGNEDVTRLWPVALNSIVEHFQLGWRVALKEYDENTPEDAEALISLIDDIVTILRQQHTSWN